MTWGLLIAIVVVVGLIALLWALPPRGGAGSGWRG